MVNEIFSIHTDISEFTHRRKDELDQIVFHPFYFLQHNSRLRVGLSTLCGSDLDALFDLFLCSFPSCTINTL